MLKRSLARAVVLAFLLVPVGAAGITYDFTSGSAVISATILDLTLVNPPTPVLLNGSPTVNVALTGDTIDFDDTGSGSLDGFNITLADTGILNLAPSVFGYTSASFTGLTLAPAGGYDGVTGVSGGPNNFTFSVGPVQVSGSFSATSATPPLPPNITNLPFVAPSPTLDGSISVGGNQIDLLGITLGALVNPLNSDEVLVFKGDLTFNGSVPEPIAMVLVGSALSCLLLRRRNQR